MMRAQGAALVVAVACIAGTMLLSTGLRCVLPESAAACAPSALVAALDANESAAAASAGARNWTRSSHPAA